MSARTRRKNAILQSRIVLNNMDDKKYDVFISHASEDKDTIVRPLVTALERIGVRCCRDNRCR